MIIEERGWDDLAAIMYQVGSVTREEPNREGGATRAGAEQVSPGSIDDFAVLCD